MALVLKDRVQETTTTTGTGTLTLSGAVDGFQSFSVIGNGNTTFYSIVFGASFEIGIGTYTSSGTLLSRDTILSSSNSNNAVNFGAGTKNVFVTYPASKSVNLDSSNNLTVPANIFNIGNVNTDTTITTNGTGDITINTNSGTNSGTVKIFDGVNGNIEITPNGTGAVVLDGLSYPIADGTVSQFLKTNGSGVLSFATQGIITVNGNYFSNYNVITADCTTTVDSSQNAFLIGPITVNSGFTWTIADGSTLALVSFGL
jgi:hypothetical protein